ncbi:MAG: 4-alpha-glucanotransferase [Candidatus Parabeggiatoa sp. nov. 2]|nr:MAG: 4-alpha-glucanotransferase [Beggiatoa sp. 4572_84]RKZ64185.1 MAG: 4-alpha-glucanotransferase [Gammaproteobacteria bacterium]
MNSNFFKKRRAGILLHPTSLPGTPGNGDLGQQAYRFVDFLADCGISLWQMLPLGPVHEDLSPYQCQSVHAANPLLISLERLVEKGWLSKDSSPSAEHELEYEGKRLASQGWLIEDALARELEQRLEQSPFREGFCPPSEHDAAVRYRIARLKEARAGFEKNARDSDRTAFAEFIQHTAGWLEDYALFRALQAEHHKALKAECLKALNEIQHHDALHARLLELGNAAGWWGWPSDLRDRHPQALEEARRRLAEVIEQHRFEQFVFFSQWQELKQYAHEKGVLMFGDIPIFVAEDSVDVWASRENFLLDERGRPTVVAGVPPDYFSATGQRWGNPLYNWNHLQADGYRWWIARLKSAKLLFDVVRIDHFRGFEACWAIPAHCDTAVEGEWLKVPGHHFFETLQQSGVDLPLVAEDLGIITHEVTHLRERFGLPGMKILQFAFDSGSDNPYLPHNHVEHGLVYTGTHDNNTTLGWFHELQEHVRQFVCEYLHAPPHEMPWPLVEAAFKSVAQWAIVPMQDVLVLDGSHRMNTPGVPTGNWRWRFDWSQMPQGAADKLRHFSHFYGRT